MYYSEQVFYLPSSSKATHKHSSDDWSEKNIFFSLLNCFYPLKKIKKRREKMEKREEEEATICSRILACMHQTHKSCSVTNIKQKIYLILIDIKFMYKKSLSRVLYTLYTNRISWHVYRCHTCEFNFGKERGERGDGEAESTLCFCILLLCLCK